MNYFALSSLHKFFFNLLFNSLIVLILSNSLLYAQEENIRIGPPAPKTSSVALKVWNDPEFQRQFAESYKAETEIEPTVTATEREELQEILTLISNDQLDQAAQRLQNSRNEASSAVYDFTLANIFFQQEKLEQAAEAYQTAVDKYAKFRRAWKNLGTIYVRQKDYEKALPALTKVIELGGNDAITYGMLGFSYSSVGNFLSAESAYRNAIMLDPKTLDWKMGLARSFFKQERYAEAIALLKSLTQENPNQIDLWLLQANAYIGMNQPLEAAEIYELIDHMGESTVESLNMLGDIYINEELYELATNVYIKAMKLSEKAKPERAIRAAKILAARGAYDETEQLVNQIEELRGGQLTDEEQKDLLKLQSRIAVAQGDEQVEVAILKEIVELDPLDGEALLLLGQYYTRQGNIEQAIFYYERAANVEGYEADAKVRHAQLLVKQGKYAEALPLLRRAQQVNHRENVQEYLEQVERLAKTS